MRRAAWFVLVLLLVSGCSSGGGSTAGATDGATDGATQGAADLSGAQDSASSSATSVSVPPAPSSTVTVSPADVPWTHAEEVRHYRAAMRPVKAELQELAKMPVSASLGDARSALRALAGASSDAAEAIRTGSWAPDLRAPANALIAALLAQQDFMKKLADKPDMAAIKDSADQTGKTLLSTQAAAAALEKVLGIGSKAIDLAPASPGAS